MAKRILYAILLASLYYDGLANASQLEGGVQETIVVNQNAVNQGLNDLKNGKSNLAHRMTINYDPMECQVTKYPGMKYYGTIATSGNWIESEDICVSICWQYQTQGYPCKSVNYIESKKTCELMQDAKGSNDINDKTYLTFEKGSVYIIPLKCKEPGKPNPQPQPTTTQPPRPQPTPGNPGTGGSSGGTTNIRPGSCGQTSVPNRVSRAYLTNRGIGQRIVGGNEARPSSVPWIVSLRRWNWHSCGGTLIRVNNQRDESDIVVTAAHCLTPGDANFDVVAGAHYTNRPKNGEDSVPASQVVIHPNYNKPGHRGNDIAIIKLSRPIKFSDTIQPACLPSPSDIPSHGTNGIVAGWGALQEGKGGPEALHQVVVPVISGDRCKQMYTIDTDNELCAGFDQGQKDACQGDSGGPYVIEGKSGWTLHGVVSWGSGCARERLPGVYARVTTYIDWINQQIRSLSSIRA